MAKLTAAISFVTFAFFGVALFTSVPAAGPFDGTYVGHGWTCGGGTSDISITVLDGSIRNGTVKALNVSFGIGGKIADGGIFKGVTDYGAEVTGTFAGNEIAGNFASFRNNCMVYFKLERVK